MYLKFSDLSGYNINVTSLQKFKHDMENLKTQLTKHALKTGSLDIVKNTYNYTKRCVIWTPGVSRKILKYLRSDRDIEIRALAKEVSTKWKY